MPLDTIIIDGDQVIFDPKFGAATVVVQPGTIVATGKTTIKGTAVCVAGDEESVLVSPCDYMTQTHLKPGKGTLIISALASNQLASHTNSGNKAMILQGGKFDAEFLVDVPAEDIKPVASGGSPIPDTTGSYPGTGEFKPANDKIQAT